MRTFRKDLIATNSPLKPWTFSKATFRFQYLDYTLKNIKITALKIPECSYHL